jgi:hypothetical protein
VHTRQRPKTTQSHAAEFLAGYDAKYKKYPGANIGFSFRGPA